jgi:hypothetical protein
MRHTSVLILTATHTTRQVPLILIFMSKKYLSPRALLRVRFIHRITSQPPLILLVAMRHPPLRLLISAWRFSTTTVAPKRDGDGSKARRRWLERLGAPSHHQRGRPRCAPVPESIPLSLYSWELIFSLIHAATHESTWLRSSSSMVHALQEIS